MELYRVKSVDVVRGFAVIWMVVFQTFDFFSRDFDLYGNFWYIFLDSFNWFSIFMLVSGVSMWLMVNKRLQKGHSRARILLNGVKRYGFYVFLSFALSLWCFNLDTFLKLNEILGAIGVFALSALVLLLILYNLEVTFVPLMFLVFGLSLWTRTFFLDRFYPFYFILPFFFAGIFLSKRVMNKKISGLLVFDLSLLPILAILVYLGDSFSYVDKALGFVLFNIFLSVLIFILAIRLEHWRVWDFFSFVGKHALIFYVFHFAVWFKLLVYLSMYQSFNLISSALLTFFATVVIFIVAKKKKKRSSLYGNRARKLKC